LQAKKKPVVVECVLNLEGLSMKEIDEAVSARLKSGKSLYNVNEEKLRTAAPTLLVTQNLCQVCGPSGNEVTQVLKTLKPPPEIVWQTPKTFEEVLEAYLELGKRTGKEEESKAWVEASRKRVADIRGKVEMQADGQGNKGRVRVAFVEWIDPIFAGGHWVGEMLEWAGGEDVNSRKGQDSVRVPWEKVVAWAPEVIIVSPCGFDLEKSREQARLLMQREGFHSLPAAKADRVYAVDANGYFARPGIRLVDGLLLLAHLMHGPKSFPWTGPADAFAHVPVEGEGGGREAEGTGERSTREEA
jgi:iron complex transport system substrate-binding protein